MLKIINVLVDNDSWILPYAERLVSILQSEHIECKLCRNHQDIVEGDVCFFLGCTKIARDEVLGKNTFNLVVHESDLPKGRGFAPVAWQILEGKDDIPVCLIEAGKSVDSGDIWLADTMKLSGTELSAEWREKQGNISIELALKFISEYETLSAVKQEGETTHYPRRRPNDSQIDIDKSFRDLIPLLRVVDNKEYPAFFEYEGCRYKLEISKYE